MSLRDVPGLGLLVAAFREFVFPPLCLACGGARTGTPGVLCAACLDSFVPLRAGDPLFLQAERRLVATGLLQGFFGAFVFQKEEPIQSALHQLKYAGMVRLGSELGIVMAHALASRLLSLRDPLLVPVPLHPAKRRERGFNQAEELCRGMGKVTSIPVRTDLLRRRRWTASQTRLGVREREVNLAGAFDAAFRAAKETGSRTIVLVDDVVTTGATLGESARTLHRAGCPSIVGCAFAVASIETGGPDRDEPA